MATVDWADGAEHIQEFPNQLRAYDRTDAARCPAGLRIIHPSDPCLVLKADSQLEAFGGGPFRCGLDPLCVAPFLNASAFSGSRLGWNGRGTILRHP